MRFEKVLLVIPPFYNLLGHFHWNYPATGVCSLAAILEQEGFKVAILNTDNDRHRIFSGKESMVRKNIITGDDVIGIVKV